MRASRLLRLLLILQNRGRTGTRLLAEELEVAQRTIFRDIEALAEAGLPIVVHRGSNGGVELGFNYRSRLLGLNRDEAEALGVILSKPHDALNDLGMAEAGSLATQKIIEFLPDSVREPLIQAQSRFRFSDSQLEPTDLRVPALVAAINKGVLVRLNSKSATPREVHPIGLNYAADEWRIIDRQDPTHPIPSADWGDINISATKF